MLTINVSSSEELIYKEFKEGNTVQFRVTVSKDEEKTYQKGKSVVVKYGKEESNGKIVSDPLVVTPSIGAEKETISLVVEKA
jgi:archaeosine-15-forming tRNA-guanine transglycosylase